MLLAFCFFIVVPFAAAIAIFARRCDDLRTRLMRLKKRLQTTHESSGS